MPYREVSNEHVATNREANDHYNCGCTINIVMYQATNINEQSLYAGCIMLIAATVHTMLELIRLRLLK